MRPLPWITILLTCLSWTWGGAIGVFATDTIESSVETALTNAQTYSSDDRYKLPDPLDLLAFEDLFLDVLIVHESGSPSFPAELIRRAENLGFSINRISDNVAGKPAGITVIHEKNGLRQGGGIYFLADTPSLLRPAVVQCPHARSDAYTGQLGLDTFRQSNVAALFCSTMRRNTSIDANSEMEMTSTIESRQYPDEDGTAEAQGESTVVSYDKADPAHQADSFFQSAHKSWMRRHPSSLIMQFHGFRTEPGNPDRTFDLIISNGMNSEQISMFFLESERLLRQCLVEYKIGLYGRDTPIFGALMNVQGQYVNRYSAGCFWHLEMEKAFRNSLMNNPLLKQMFVTCITRLIQAYENY